MKSLKVEAARMVTFLAGALVLIAACTPENPSESSDTGTSDVEFRDTVEDGDSTDAEARETCSSSVETCNGLDDDCDGEVDEELSRKCSNQKGVCRGAELSCSDGSFPDACDADDYGSDYEQVESSCDGKDNDCDGKIDGWSSVCGPWRQIGSDAPDEINAVRIDEDGNMYVAGDAEGNFAGEQLNGRQDPFIAKFNRRGTLLWVEFVSSSRPVDAGFDDLALDSSGAIYASGTEDGSPLVAKYQPSGMQAWKTILNFTNNGSHTAIEVDSGSVYAVGYLIESDDLSDGTFNSFIRELDSTDGTTVLQSKNINGVSFRDIAIGGGGDLYVGGRTHYKEGVSGSFLEGPGNHHAVLVKFNASDLSTGWSATLKGKGDQVVQSVAHNGFSIYVAGKASVGLEGKELDGRADGFAARYSALGDREWLNVIGSRLYDSATRIDAGPDDDLHVFGMTEADVADVANSGSFDGLYVRYDLSGNREDVKVVGKADEEIFYGGAAHNIGVFGVGQAVPDMSGDSTAGFIYNLE